MDISASALAVLGLCALLIGISKTGLPGLAIVGVVLVPLVIPAKLSTGYILPFLIFSDVVAIAYWRRSAIWRLIIAVLPAMFIGIVTGYFLMDCIADAVYGQVLGGTVLSMLILDWARRRFDLPIPVNSRGFAWTMGFFAGVLTMLANAAGPVMMIYLLAMNPSKEEFVATNAWLYGIINISKVPFSVSLGLMSLESLAVNLMLLPCVLIGAFTGIRLIRSIPTKAFNTAMRALAFAGALKLFF